MSTLTSDIRYLISRLHGNERSLPLRFVFIFLKRLVEIHDDVVAVLSHREAIETARRAARILDVDAVGREARVMFGTLELVLFVRPLERRVLMRTGKRIRVHFALPAR